MTLHERISNEAERNRLFPVTRGKIFMAHAGVSPLPGPAAEAISEFADRACRDNQEGDWTWPLVRQTRERAAELLGCESGEIALLGPTALNLNLVANGLNWQRGDEVVFYQDDYPADVYPWLKLRDLGVTPVRLKPERHGVITWDLVESVLTARTRLVALATCSYLAGYRIDIETIGRGLRDRGILFSLDGIQTLGAFPTPARCADFISADSHKWLLGPVGAGIFYVKASRFETLKPTLLGAWNVDSPDFVAQEDLVFHPTARRYEPGSLNLPGLLGMNASLGLLLDFGLEAISARLLEIRQMLLTRLRPLGFRLLLEDEDLDPSVPDTTRTAIVTLTHPRKDLAALFKQLAENQVVASLRRNRQGQPFLRLSPHFYNTDGEIERVVQLLENDG